MIDAARDESGDADVLVADALLEFLNAQDQGAAIDPESWLSGFSPEVRIALREILEGLALLGPPPGPNDDRRRKSAAPPKLDDFGAYINLEHLATGGMGIIYRGKDKVLGRQVAVKVIHQHYAENPRMVLRFQEEARVASRLQHPNIAPVHEMGEIPVIPRRPYFTMKLIEGRTLAEAIREYHASPNDQDRETLLRHFIAVCNAVDYAHGRQILHRDLKPLNVMVGAYGEVQVMDWGLSKALAASPAPGRPAGPWPVPEKDDIGGPSPEFSVAGAGPRGTWPYMPPEQADGKGVGPWSDVFGLGAILCEILTGQPPYLGETRAEVEKKARAVALDEAYLRLDGSGAPAEVIAIALRCLQAKVEDRPESAGAVAGLVTEYMADRERLRREAELAAAKAEVRVAEERKRRRVQLGLAAAILLLVAGGLAVGLWSRYAADRAARILVADKADALRRLIPALEKTRILRAEHRWKDALDAARGAEVIARDRLIDPDRRREAESHVADLDKEVKEDERDRELLTRSFEVVAIDETTLVNPALEGQPSKYDAKLASLFRKYGIDLASMSDDAIVARVNTRPVDVRRDVASVVDLWIFGDRDDDRPYSLLNRLYRLVQQIDPDPSRNELRSILEGQHVFPKVKTLLAPITRKIPGSDHNKLLAIAESLDLSTAPSHTIRLVSLGLVTVNETDRAVGVLREATQARPEESSLHTWLATILMIQVPPRWQEAIPVLQTVRALQPDSGGVLATLLARTGRYDEALQICQGMARRQSKSGWPHAYRAIVLVQRRRAAHSLDAADEALEKEPTLALAHAAKVAALLRLNRLVEAEAVARQAIREEPFLSLSHSNLGIALLGQSRFAEALEAFDAARKLEPNQGLIHANRGVVLTKLLRKDEAISAARVGLRLDPNNYDVLVGVASVLSDNRQFEEAERLARKAVQLLPGAPEAHAVLGQVLIYRKEFVEAEKECREAIRADPIMVLGHSNLAACLAEQRKFVEAEAAARQAIAIDPNQSLSLNNLGMILLLTDRVAEAEPFLRKALKLDPNLATTHANLARLLIQSQRLKEAEAEAREAIRLDKDSFFGHCNLGGLFYKQKRYAEAEAELASALRIDPRSGVVLSNHAIALLKLSRPSEAEKEALEAEALAPGDPQVQCQLGEVLTARGKTGAAIAAYRKAIALKPNDAFYHYGLGSRLLASRKGSEALASLRRALELAPWEGDIQYLAGDDLVKLGQFDESEKALRAAIRLKPGRLGAYDSLGKMLEKQGRPEDARKVFQEATRVEPKDTTDCFILGRFFARLGDLKKQEEVYRKALILDPRSLDAHNDLADLLRKSGNENEALAVLTRAIDLEPKRDSSLIFLAREFQFLRQWQTASDLFNKAIRRIGTGQEPKQKQNRGEAYIGLGDCLVGLDKPEEAIDYYRKATLESPEDEFAWVPLANTLSNLGRFEESIEAYRTAIRLSPDFAAIYGSLGYDLIMTGRFLEAIPVLQKLVDLERNDPDGFFRLGYAMEEVGESSGAIEALKRAIALGPKASGACGLLGAAYRQLGDSGEAMKILANAEEFQPRSFRAFWERAALKAEAGDLASSKSDLETALGLWPKEHQMRAEAQAGLDQLNRLVALASKQDDILAGRVKPADPGEGFLFARIASARQDQRAAVRFYERALDAGAGGGEEFSIPPRIAAARRALLAGAGQPPDGVDDRPALREKARRWITEEVEILRKSLGSGEPRARSTAHRLLRYCQSNSAFGIVRDEDAIARLAEPERAPWNVAWKSIEALRNESREIARK